MWYYKDLYVKALPHCLLNFHFWRTHLAALPPQTPDQASLYAVALGFVLSYPFLIRHESDFYVTQTKSLLLEKVSYIEFQRYIHPFYGIQDSQVSPRWQFGQLRRTRLNRALRLAQPPSRRGKGFLQRIFYLQVYWQMGQSLADIVTMLLFIYASFSLSLAAMSLIHATRSPRWGTVRRVSWGYAVAGLMILAGLWSCIGLVVSWKFLAQLCFALKERWSRGQVSANQECPNLPLFSVLSL
ncbi:hypothetical protein BJX68DRAFT_272525 [Aspergillus pseudodeflectus]|uniref:Uncharacterized protein n=1 Tax=Aspergillus pseudodeflectus TaxID=176178 RepID=A0ABR4JEY6_9EURO